MKRKKMYVVFFSVMGLIACSEETSEELVNEITIEQKINGKWFHYREEELDDNGNVQDFLDLSGKECNSSFIVFKAGSIKEEEHADPNQNCEKFDYPGTWNYDKTNNELTIVDNEDGYVVKGTIVTVNTSELRIKLTQQGDDSDFDGWNTHLVFKKTY